MRIGLEQGATAHRQGDAVTLLRLSPTGGRPAAASVPAELADAWRLATGDVVTGHWEEFDHPDAAELADPAGAPPVAPMHRLTRINTVNGLAQEAALERPFARTRRNALERAAPIRRLALARSPSDVAGRVLDFAAPLGAGAMGVVAGPHGAGMTSALRAIAASVVANAPDCPVIAVLIAPRMEEVTDWRRGLPGVETVVCPAADDAAGPRLRAFAADLALAAAQRQTEMGRDAVLLVDSLTALWNTLLEAEQADAQEEADHAGARRRIREWVDAAGKFAEETPLGPAIGGSLTIVGTAWAHALDEDAEEEKELPPALRLMEHVTPAVTWRLTLSGELARRRMHPAVDVSACRSDHEGRLVGDALAARLRRARAGLAAMAAWEARQALADAVEATPDLEALAARLAGPDEPAPANLADRWEALLRRQGADADPGA